MSFIRRRAIWLAIAASMLAFASTGAPLVRDAPTADPGRASIHQVVDHDAVVSARPQVERSPLDLQPGHSRLLMLAWVSVLLGAALLARTAGRSVEVHARRAGSAAPPRRRFDRGPPAPVCA